MARRQKPYDDASDLATGLQRYTVEKLRTELRPVAFRVAAHGPSQPATRVPIEDFPLSREGRETPPGPSQQCRHLRPPERMAPATYSRLRRNGVGQVHGRADGNNLSRHSLH